MSRLANLGEKTHRMDITEIVDAINEEIARLTHARNLLTGSQDSTDYQTGMERRPGPKPGRAAAARSTAPTKKAKRNISPEGKARIAAAQKLRWANTKR